MFSNINFKKSKNGSITADSRIMNKFISNPDFSYLVSFPRTGSHWLRMMMELYFGKPSLIRIFYFEEVKEFTCYHTHDLDLKVERNNVIYLCRNPVDTIFSQINYHQENMNDLARIRYWSQLYGRHLEKWLLKESFTKKKTIITYESLKENYKNEFQKLCEHFNFPYDSCKIKEIYDKVSKEEVRRKTKHDPQVINSVETYNEKRKEFAKNYRNMINEIIHNINPMFKTFFEKTEI